MSATGSLSPNNAQPSKAVREYPFRQPMMWFLRRRGYVLYMLRELTAVPIALWMLLLLVEIATKQPLFGNPVVIVVSVLCLLAALWHAYTFLSLAGLIMRIPVGEGTVPARAIVTGAFGLFAVATVVVAAVLIWGGM